MDTVTTLSGWIQMEWQQGHGHEIAQRLPGSGPVLNRTATGLANLTIGTARLHDDL